MPQIRTLCRIKPTAEYYPEFEASRNTLYLRVPEVLRDYSNTPGVRPRANVSHEFHFDYIFKNTATQEEVFDVAAKEIVQAFVNGYNGTIFAYGQTGTGKTFTVEGSPKQYKHRGLEPRSLSMIYKELEKRTDEDISVHISYLEIYQEVGYDLLNPGARTQSVVTPFPKVSVLEGNAGVWTVRNLSVHYAATEEVAQNLLLQGQANRRVAATTVHDRSSRSHAVFTIQLSAKKPDSDVVVKSKLHLVDLAGSERVSKTGVQGNLLNEAKSINLSLHFLETVIIALQGDSTPTGRPRRNSAGHQRSPYKRDTGRPSTADGSSRASRHVPYRNSLLTMVLRDSLGGNCMTCMIATISLEYPNLGETLSTCRFAGRVACIANNVKSKIWRNEEVDEKALIKKLRKRVAELETELSCLLMAKEDVKFSLDMMNAKLTDEDKIQCNKVVKSYIDGKVADPVSEGITNPYKFRECLKILKKMVLEGYFNSSDPENMPDFPQYGEDDQENPVRASSTPDKDVQAYKAQRDRHKNQEKTVQIPIPTRSAWGEETYHTEQEQPIRRPRNRQRQRQSQPMGEHYTDDEGRRPDSDGEVRKSKTETLTNMLRQSRSRRKYKSPFEKKRIKEIQKLNEKVETLQKTQISKEGQLVKMKINMAEEELNLMEEQIRTKLNVTKEQLQDQKAYVKQLETVEADKETIEREKLVEKQLRKKTAKAEKKIDVIEEKRKQLVQHSTEVDREMTTAKPTINEQFGKYRKRDGSLNTRQVFDMLKTEEKKQEKIQNQLEHERMVMLSQQLELKEAATRQKLKDFKEMLRMSHSAGFPDGHMGGGLDGRAKTAPRFGDVPDNRGREEVGLDDIGDQNQEPVRTIYTRESGTTHLNNEPLSRIMTAHESHKTVKDEEPVERPISRQSIRSTKSVIPDSEFYAKRKQEKDPTTRWESPYSRPSTACSQRQPEIELIHMQPKKLEESDEELQYGLTDDVKSARESRKSTAVSKNTTQNESVNGIDDDLEDYETLIPSEYIYGMSTRDKFDGRKMGLASTTFDAALAQMLEKGDQNVYYDQDDYDQFARTSKSHSYDRDSSFDRELAMLNLKAQSRERERDLQYIYGSPKSSRNTRQSRGRTRQKHVFDSDEEMDSKPKSPVKRDRSLEDWEARMLQRSARRSQKNSARKKNKYSNSDDDNDKPKRVTNYENWGPQTKHASIASRLASMTVATPPPVDSRPTKSANRYTAPTEIPDLTENDEIFYPSRTGSLVIEETRSRTVKALPDDEAESSFMGKVQEQRQRVSKIRQARNSAEVIQKAWRKYQSRKKFVRL